MNGNNGMLRLGNNRLNKEIIGRTQNNIKSELKTLKLKGHHINFQGMNKG